MAAQKEMVGWPQSIGKAKQRFNVIAKNAQTGMVWERESMFALQAIGKSDRLQKANPSSIRDAIINVASIGLSLNPAEKLAYLVPRDGVAVLDVSYQGLLKLATDTGSVSFAKVELVYKDDEFEYKDMNTMPFFKPSDPFKTTRGPLRGAFCVAQLANGSKLIELMGVDEIHKIRDQSKAYKNKSGKSSGPWVTWYEEMVKKTVMKRAYKTWPKSTRMSEAIDIINHHEGIDFNDAVSAPVEAEVVLMVNETELTELNSLVASSKVDPKRILTAFQIDNLANLPAEKFDECKSRLVTAKAMHDSKQKSDDNANT